MAARKRKKLISVPEGEIVIAHGRLPFPYSSGWMYARVFCDIDSDFYKICIHFQDFKKCRENFVFDHYLTKRIGEAYLRCTQPTSLLINY